MGELYLEHFHAIITHSVEGQDHRSPVAIRGPMLVNQMRAGCPGEDGFRVTQPSLR